jgi:hypothetical protein
VTNAERSPIARYLRQLASVPGTGGLTDAQLLERFVAHLMNDNYNARPATDRIPGQLRRLALLSDN